MHRASLGDFRKPNALIARQWSGELEGALDLIETHRSVFALKLIGGV